MLLPRKPVRRELPRYPPLDDEEPLELVEPPDVLELPELPSDPPEMPVEVDELEDPTPPSVVCFSLAIIPPSLSPDELADPSEELSAPPAPTSISPPDNSRKVKNIL